MKPKCSSSRFSYMILRMYHTMALIMAETSLFPNHETLFDRYWSNFLSILSYAVKSKITMDPSPVIAALPKTFTEMQASIIDIGWIPALYYTAIKCRIGRIRLHAIRLLESTTHREGFWDAGLVAEVAREVMRIEGGGEYDDMNDGFGIGCIPGKDEIFLPTLSESQLLRDVEAVLPDGSQTGVILMCRRRADDEWEHIKRQCSTLLKHWMDMVLDLGKI